jgi:hypothetical protein
MLFLWALRSIAVQFYVVMVFSVYANNIPINKCYLLVSSCIKGYKLYENNIPTRNVVGTALAFSISK